jgi:hypothetical protein
MVDVLKADHGYCLQDPLEVSILISEFSQNRTRD